MELEAVERSAYHVFICYFVVFVIRMYLLHSLTIVHCPFTEYTSSPDQYVGQCGNCIFKGALPML